MSEIEIDDIRARLGAVTRMMNRHLVEQLYGPSPLMDWLEQCRGPRKPVAWWRRKLWRIRSRLGDCLYSLSCWVGGQSYGGDD